LSESAIHAQQLAMLCQCIGHELRVEPMLDDTALYSARRLSGDFAISAAGFGRHLQEGRAERRRECKNHAGLCTYSSISLLSCAPGGAGAAISASAGGSGNASSM